jgi:sterol desaturase/sphingolipid hydroxylase (fatty acid hydroxylase superfamily)
MWHPSRVDEKYVALAVPFFFALIGFELLVLRTRGPRGAYRFADSITNLSCGIGQQVLEPFFKSVALLPYAWLWVHARLFDLSPRSPFTWAGMVVGVDLFFYAFHRASHRVGFLWAVHAVHHQSEEYNLSVALRQPWLQSLFAPFFYLPLAVLGFPPILYPAAVTIDTLYQFWIHTRAIGRLGPLEWILNTPSHHRVHHGINPEYLDRNYGGIFIVWDRLFGSFRREDHEPVYGTVKPAASWNPFGVNALGWADLARMSRTTARVADKVRVWFAPPEWRPADLGGPVVVTPADPAAHPRYDARASRSVQVYVAFQLVLAVLGAMAYLWFAVAAPRPLLLFVAATFVATVVAWGGLLERKPWAWPLEIARLGAAAALLAYIVG